MANFSFPLRFIIPAVALSGLMLVALNGDADADLTNRNHRHAGTWDKTYVHTNWWRPIRGGSSETTTCNNATDCGTHTRRGYQWLKHNTSVTWTCSYGGRAWKTYHDRAYSGPSAPPRDAGGVTTCRSPLHVATTTTTRVSNPPPPTSPSPTTTKPPATPPPTTKPPVTPPPTTKPPAPPRPRPNPQPNPTTTTTTTLAPVSLGWNSNCGPFNFTQNRRISETELPSYGAGRHYLSGSLPPGLTWRAVQIDPQDRNWRLVRVSGKPTRAGNWTVRLRAAVTGPDPSITCTFRVAGPSWSGRCWFYLTKGTYANLTLPRYGPGNYRHEFGSGRLPPGMSVRGMTVRGRPRQVGYFILPWRAIRGHRSVLTYCRFIVTAPPTTTTTTTTTTTSTTTSTTTTTTTSTTTTTIAADPPVSCSWQVNAAAAGAITGEIGWATRVPLSETGQANPPHPNTPGGGEFLVVTGDLGAGAFPDVWPTWEDAAVLDVTDTGGCAWTAQTVITRARQLFMWNESEAALIRQAAPVEAERWDRMDTGQRARLQRQLQGAWRRLGGAGADNRLWVGSACPLTTPAADRDRLCRWGLPHPGVYQWETTVAYSTVEESTGDELESELIIASGVNRFLRLVDYASFQGRR